MPKFLFVLLLFFPSVVISQNIVADKKAMEEKKEVILKKWEDIENNFQRRSDLVPQIVSLLKSTFPKNDPLLTQVLSARDSANIQLVAEYDQLNFFNIGLTQKRLSECLNKLYVESEQYHNLRADRLYIVLNSELFGSENRIYFSIKRYNEAIDEYNNAVEIYNNSVESHNKLAIQNGEELLPMEFYLLYMNHIESDSSESVF